MGFWENLLDGMEPITVYEKSDKFNKKFSPQVSGMDNIRALAPPPGDIGTIINNIKRKRF